MNVKLEQLSKHFGKRHCGSTYECRIKAGNHRSSGSEWQRKNHTAAHDGQRTASDEDISYNGDNDATETGESCQYRLYAAKHLGMYPTFRVEEFLQYRGLSRA